VGSDKCIRDSTNAYTADTTGLTADAGADTTYLTADMAGYMSNIVNIFVTQNFSEVPAPETMWALNTEELTTQRFCVTGVTEKDGIVFEISAVQHIAGKFEAIDYATKIVIPPTTIIPPVSQAAPETVTISAFSVLVQGRTAYSAAIECSSVQGAVAYEFEWRRDDSDWISAGKTGSTRKEIPNILSGSYLARVRAINSLGVSSLWTVSMLTELDGLIAPPPQVSSLTTSSIVFGIKINWSFPASLNIIERTEIYYSTTNNFANAIKLGDFAYPQNTHTMMGLSAGMSLYFWAKLIDKNGLPGERYPSGTTGVLGQASANAGEILGYLTEQITSTQLSAALMTEIDKIAINETAIQATETAIQTETTARVNGDNALASQINTVSAVADGNVAAIQTETTARVGIENDLAAMYTIKTQLTSDGRTYVAGIGVGVENNQGIIESQVLVKADRFAVINPTGTGVVVPFVVQGNQVFISSAFINELSAEVLKATWAQVDELIAGKLRSADSRMVIDLNNVTFTMLKGAP
jgi:predicted phage tail protein